MPRRIRPEGEERKDTYPDGAHYQDTGCNLHPTCLNCPLPVCKYDLAQEGKDKTLRLIIRNATIKRMYREEAAPKDIASYVGVSERTVFRVVSGKE